MSLRWIFFVWILAFPIYASAFNIGDSLELTTSSGERIKNCTLRRVDPDGISVTTDYGVRKISFTELPDDLKERFGYDPEAAEAFLAKVAIDQAEANRRGAAARAAEHAERIERYENHAQSVQEAQNSKTAPIQKVIGTLIDRREDGIVIVDGGTEEAQKVRTTEAMRRRQKNQQENDLQNIIANGRPGLSSVGGGRNPTISEEVKQISGLPQVWGKIAIIKAPQNTNPLVLWKIRKVGERNIEGTILPLYVYCP